MNYKFLGVDISSSNIGISYFERCDNNLRLNDIFNIQLNTALELYERFDEFEKINLDFDFAILESSLKSFNQGFSNKNALLQINSANLICSYILFKNAKKIFKVHPLSYRSAAGFKKSNDNIKLLVLDFVIKNEIFQNYLIEKNILISNVFPQREITRGKNKGKLEYETGCYDKSDSFLIGYGGEIALKKKGEIK